MTIEKNKIRAEREACFALSGAGFCGIDKDRYAVCAGKCRFYKTKKEFKESAEKAERRFEKKYGITIKQYLESGRGGKDTDEGKGNTEGLQST